MRRSWRGRSLGVLGFALVGCSIVLPLSEYDREWSDKGPADASMEDGGADGGGGPPGDATPADALAEGGILFNACLPNEAPSTLFCADFDGILSTSTLGSVYKVQITRTGDGAMSLIPSTRSAPAALLISSTARGVLTRAIPIPDGTPLGLVRLSFNLQILEAPLPPKPLTLRSVVTLAKLSLGTGSSPNFGGGATLGLYLNSRGPLGPRLTVTATNDGGTGKSTLPLETSPTLYNEGNAWLAVQMELRLQEKPPQALLTIDGKPVDSSIPMEPILPLRSVFFQLGVEYPADGRLYSAAFDNVRVEVF